MVLSKNDHNDGGVNFQNETLAYSTRHRQVPRPSWRSAHHPGALQGMRTLRALLSRHVLERSDQMNEKGYHPPRAVRPERCVACRLCELLCPEFCIYVVENKSVVEVEERE